MKGCNVRARVRGEDVAGFLSAVCAEKTVLYDINRGEKELNFLCREKDEGVLKKIAASKGLAFEVVSRKNTSTRLKQILRHAGALSAALVVAATFVASRFFVFSVAVEGVSAERAAEITSILAGYGVDGITLKSRINTDEIEKIVAGQSDDLAFAEAYIDGVKLVVSAKEQLPQPVKENEEGALYSCTDAIVTRVEVSGGTALVKPGDTVKKGQTLIGDYIVVGDVADPEHKEIQTAAKGEVYGRVWYYTRLLIPEFRTVFTRTGNKHTSTALYVRDKCILPQNVNHGYEDFDAVTERTQVNSVIPFSLVTTTWYETVKSTVKTDDAYIESEVYAAFASLKTQLDPSATVEASYKSQKKVDNLYIIIIYYEVEQPICCREA